MEDKTPDIIDVTLIAKDIKVTLEMDSNMHTRLQQLLISGLSCKDSEHFRKCLKEIGENKIEDPLAYHMQTVIALLEGFELAASKQNHVITKKFSFTDNKFLEDNPSK